MARKFDVSRRRATCALLGAATLPLFARIASAQRAKHVNLFYGDALARYGFQGSHPFGVDRQGAFFNETKARGLDQQVTIVAPAPPASREVLQRFHTKAFVDMVEGAEKAGLEFLDKGDTPVFPNVFESASIVVGTALDGLERVLRGEVKRTLQPIGGLHHAGRGHAAGFCVFSDLGVVIETLRMRGIKRIGYIDIDVHHGDGIFYPYEDDPDLIFVDVHQDGKTLYPGTGGADETGKGAAEGTKLNLPLPPGSGDAKFLEVWPQALAHLEKFKPEFFVFQCGADGLKGDPLARLEYSPNVHAHAARTLKALADRHAKGRIMAFGGGGYSRSNLAAAWNNVLGEFLAN